MELMSNDSKRTKTVIRDGSVETTQPHNWQFTNISTAAWPAVLHCEVVHDNFFPT
jgi:hypothetical protein